ncbi:hypothetical protein LDO31_18770 [Luteimonas sp. XNQY3]|nr:hypothetical protein [Luteimonas sp. XNQY3]MCD9008235.1 hypothetical protein [Luteimonas sp. XNQY3]
MSNATIWFWIGIGCIVAAAILLAAARMRPRSNDSRHVSASHGGVAIGGDNKGNITTNTTDLKSPRSFWQVAGVVVGIVGLVIAALAWLFPKVS